MSGTVPALRATMTRTIALILVTLFSVACGGEPFAGADLYAVGSESVAGEAGTTDAAGSPAATSAGAPSDGSPVSLGGGSGVGGSGSSAAGAAGDVSSVAGKPAGGASQGGTGGAPVTCELDTSRVTAALPDTFAWKDFELIGGNVCAHCTYEPCGQLSPSWGEPTVLGDHVVYSPTITSAASVPLLVQVARNDGACSGGAQCELKINTASVGLSMVRKGDAWLVEDVSVFVTFVDNGCLDSTGKPGGLSGPVAKDIQDEIRASLVGLKIPCD